MSDGSKLFEHLNFLIVVTKFEQLEFARSIIDLLKRNSSQICILHKCFDTKAHEIPQNLKSWFANDVTEGNTIHFIISEDVNFPFYRVASVDFLIPVVRPEWIYNCIESQKHSRTSLFSSDPAHVFKGFQIYVSRHSFNNSEYLFYTEAVHALGGTCVDFLSNKTTHLVTKDSRDPGILAVLNFGNVEPMNFVYPTWIIQSFKQLTVAPEDSHNISPDDSDSISKCKLEDIWGRLNEIDFKVTSNIWEGHSFIIGMDISLNRDLYSTLIEFLQANGGTVHRHLDESDITKTSADCYIGKSVSSREYEIAENKKLHLGNLIWIFYMWSLGQFIPPTEKLIFSPFKRKLLETNQLITAYTNFFGQQRFYIQRLVNALGGFTTSELSRRNTHLLCRFPFGKKFETAKNWGDKCVITNYLWLEECYKQSKRLDPLQPRFQQLPVEGGLQRTLGQMKWDNSESQTEHLSKESNKVESEIQNVPLPSHDGGQDTESRKVEQPTPELRPMVPEPIEEPIDFNENVEWREKNKKTEHHIAENHIVENLIEEDKKKSDSKQHKVDINSEVIPDDEHPHANKINIERTSRNNPTPSLAKSMQEQNNSETVLHMRGTIDNQPNSQEQKLFLENISDVQNLPINQHKDLKSGKPLGQTQDINSSTEKRHEDVQESSQRDLQKTKVIQEDVKSTNSVQETNEQELPNKNGDTNITVQEKEQPLESPKKSIEPIGKQERSQNSEGVHVPSIEKTEQHQESEQKHSVIASELDQHQKLPEGPQLSIKQKSQRKASQHSEEFTGKFPVPSGPTSENLNETRISTNYTPSSKVPTSVHVSQTNMHNEEDIPKSQTPPSALTPTSIENIHSSQGSRRAAKTKAARKLHDDIESLNEFQRNTKRKKTGNLLPEEIAQLEKTKALEIQAKEILSKIIPEENDPTKNDTESEVTQQHRQKKLPYHIDAVCTGLSENISDLDQTILRLLGITIHSEITSENFVKLDGVIAPKKLRTAKFLKSLSFRPLKYALTPKFLKDILRIVHKGKRANLSLDISRYYIPDTNHEKLLKLTSLPNKVFERGGILSVNIISDIPGGVDTISSILKAHGVKETKSIPASHMNGLSLEDFSLNDTDAKVTSGVPLRYIFLVNKATQVRFFKKLTKNSNHSALAVAWDWFITSIFHLEVNVNNSDHVIFRSG